MLESGGEDWSWDDGGPLPEPPVDLPDDPEPERVDPVEELLRNERNRNVNDGQRALWLINLVLTTSPIGPISSREQVAGEVGAALNLGPVTAESLVNVSMALAQRLPATLRAVCDGVLSWQKATVLAEMTAGLTDEQARAVEAATLGAAGARTIAQHRDAVRRAVIRVDPEGADERRKQAARETRMAREHFTDGTGELFARMPSEELETVWTGCDLWARSAKAAGDPRTLEQLRVAALVHWASTSMRGGTPDAYGPPAGPVVPTGDGPTNNAASGGATDNHATETETGTTDDDASADDPADDAATDSDATETGTTDDDASADDPADDDATGEDATTDGSDDAQKSPSRPPTRHGRAAALYAFWDLTSLLGLTRHCGELSDSGAVLGPATMAELVAGGVAIRRMLLDPTHGHLVDLTPHTWKLPRTKHTDLDAPVVLGVTLTTDLWHAINNGTADACLLAAIAAAPQAVRDLLAHEWTAEQLDNAPRAYPAPARLADFVATRDRHPTHPTAGPTAASAADIEHNTPFREGGTTTRRGLSTCGRRFHRLKTHGGWNVEAHGHGWKWTSPRGRDYYTHPYDYRLGP